MDQDEVTASNRIDNPAYLADSYELTATLVELGGQPLPAIMFEFTNSASNYGEQIMFVGSIESLKQFALHFTEAVDTACVQASTYVAP